MEHGQQHLPNRETQLTLTERLGIIQRFLNGTSGLLIQRAFSLMYSRPLQTPAQAAHRLEQFSVVVNQYVETAATALIDLRNDTNDNLRITSPHDTRTYGKLCGLTYSREDLAYVAGVALSNSVRMDWPIFEASQLFIGNRPPARVTSAPIGGTTGQQVDLHTPLHSVVSLNNGPNHWRP